MTRQVKVGAITMGGGAQVTVQSMTNTDTADYNSTAEQIKRLVSAGCDVVRLAVRNERDVEVCKRYIADFSVPLVADIQFDYRLAVACADIGFAKVRFNPGNTSADGLCELVSSCKANGTAIRVGINGGSLEKEVKKQYGATPRALVVSAMNAVRALEKLDFYDVVVSVKASSVRAMVEANRLFSAECDCPVHLGVTESGSGEEGLIKSAMGIGALLLDGIGDTIRVSLTGDPVREVTAADKILRAAGLRKGCEIVSCPTCARCNYDLERVAETVKTMTIDTKKPVKIAVMGCVVNGPGESADADLGIAGGDGKAVLFKKGEIYKVLPSAEAEQEFYAEVKRIIE